MNWRIKDLPCYCFAVHEPRYSTSDHFKTYVWSFHTINCPKWCLPDGIWKRRKSNKIIYGFNAGIWRVNNYSNFCNSFKTNVQFIELIILIGFIDKFSLNWFECILNLNKWIQNARWAFFTIILVSQYISFAMRTCFVHVFKFFLHYIRHKFNLGLQTPLLKAKKTY